MPRITQADIAACDFSFNISEVVAKPYHHLALDQPIATTPVVPPRTKSYGFAEEDFDEPGSAESVILALTAPSSSSSSDDDDKDARQGPSPGQSRQPSRSNNTKNACSFVGASFCISAAPSPPCDIITFSVQTVHIRGLHAARALPPPAFPSCRHHQHHQRHHTRKG